MGSISPTFYENLFCRKVLCANYLFSLLMFVITCRKKISKKLLLEIDFLGLYHPHVWHWIRVAFADRIFPLFMAIAFGKMCQIVVAWGKNLWPKISCKSFRLNFKRKLSAHTYGSLRASFNKAHPSSASISCVNSTLLI